MTFKDIVDMDSFQCYIDGCACNTDGGASEASLLAMFVVGLLAHAFQKPWGVVGQDVFYPQWVRLQCSTNNNRLC